MMRTRRRSSSPWRPTSCRRCRSTSTFQSRIASSDAMPRCVAVFLWARVQHGWSAAPGTASLLILVRVGWFCHSAALETAFFGCLCSVWTLGWTPWLWLASTVRWVSWRWTWCQREAHWSPRPACWWRWLPKTWEDGWVKPHTVLNKPYYPHQPFITVRSHKKYILLMGWNDCVVSLYQEPVYKPHPLNLEDFKNAII